MVASKLVEDNVANEAFCVVESRLHRGAGDQISRLLCKLRSNVSQITSAEECCSAYVLDVAVEC